MADDVPKASVKIEGVDMSANVDSIDVEDHDQAIDRARVVFDDSKAVIGQLPREQNKVEISLGWNSENALIFQGVVVSVKAEAAGMAHQRVTVTAYDLSYKLKQGTPKKRDAFTSGKLSDALKKILADYASAGIAVGDIVPDPDPTFTSVGPTLVKREAQSDWDFIQELARKYRARAFVEVNDNQSKFYFVSEKSLLKGDPMGTLFYCPNGTGKLIKFDYQRNGSGASPAQTTTVIDPQTGEPVTKVVTPPAPEAPLKVDDDAGQQASDAADAIGKAEGKPEDARPTPIVAGQPSDPVGVEQNIQQDPTRILGFSGKGTAVGTVKLRAKGKVTINGLAPWAEGDWYVHQVNHIYQRSVVTDAKRKERDRSTFLSKLAVTR
jgi:phage protein D